jgi:hypothetical protein
MSRSKSTDLTKEEEEEKRDKELLMQTTAKIDGIVQLLMDGNDRNTATEKVNKARLRANENENDEEHEERGKPRRKEMVFHPYKGKRVAIAAKTSKILELGDALELQIQTNEHGENLLRSLQASALTPVRILERQLRRMN